MKLEIKTTRDINKEDYELFNDTLISIKKYSMYRNKKWVSVESLKELINHIMVVEKCTRLEWLHERLLKELEEK